MTDMLKQVMTELRKAKHTLTGAYLSDHERNTILLELNDIRQWVLNLAKNPLPNPHEDLDRRVREKSTRLVEEIDDLIISRLEGGRGAHDHKQAIIDILSEAW